MSTIRDIRSQSPSEDYLLSNLKVEVAEGTVRLARVSIPFRGLSPFQPGLSEMLLQHLALCLNPLPRIISFPTPLYLRYPQSEPHPSLNPLPRIISFPTLAGRELSDCHFTCLNPLPRIISFPTLLATLAVLLLLTTRLNPLPRIISFPTRGS